MNIKLLTELHLEFVSLKEAAQASSESTLVKMPHCWKSHVVAQLSHIFRHSNYLPSSNLILTHTSNAKCFRRIILINKQGLAEIIVSFRGYGRHSPNQKKVF